MPRLHDSENTCLGVAKYVQGPACLFANALVLPILALIMLAHEFSNLFASLPWQLHGCRWGGQGWGGKAWPGLAKMATRRPCVQFAIAHYVKHALLAHTHGKYPGEFDDT